MVICRSSAVLRRRSPLRERGASGNSYEWQACALGAPANIGGEKEGAMVDPKETNERAVETGSGLAARKAWVKPHLESLDIAVDTANGPTHTTSDGAGTSVS